jgi:multiple antibiotic resistance protein
LLEFGLLAFVSLFTMINPLGVLPVYVSMTAALSSAQSRTVAGKATLTAFLILVGFAFTGQLIFQFFGISVNSLRVVGGIIFFLMGYEMLQARLSRTVHDEPDVQDYMEDIAITPLGIPMIAGPGAITSVILLMNESADWAQRGMLLGAISGVMGLTWVFLIGAKRVVAVLGANGNKVMMRLMGLIVMVIAVEFFFSGLRPLAPGLFK